MNLQTLVLKIAASKAIADALEQWRVQRDAAQERLFAQLYGKTPQEALDEQQQQHAGDKSPPLWVVEQEKLTCASNPGQ